MSGFELIPSGAPGEKSESVVGCQATLYNITWEKHFGGLYELPVAA